MFDSTKLPVNFDYKLAIIDTQLTIAKKNGKNRVVSEKEAAKVPTGTRITKQ